MRARVCRIEVVQGFGAECRVCVVAECKGVQALRVFTVDEKTHKESVVLVDTKRWRELGAKGDDLPPPLCYEQQESKDQPGRSTYRGLGSLGGTSERHRGTFIGSRRGQRGFMVVAGTAVAKTAYQVSARKDNEPTTLVG